MGKNIVQLLNLYRYDKRRNAKCYSYWDEQKDPYKKWLLYVSRNPYCDVLKYIDTNCCFIDDGEWHKSRDMKALDALLHSLFYNFVGKQDRPIDEQDELCIKFVFDLIKK